MLSTAKKLYDTDFNLWVEETANLLKEGKWEYLDLENLIEEIEAMGRSDKKALKSNLEKLFWLFGLCYVMDWGYRGWNPYVARHLAIFVNCF
ncbi:DUF29 domain-containing protein [Microcystis aeruginosa]|jgi:hypothetical protein|uniref:DUF29 domain-containing protein n=1 Tax=Microcystis aeruginosa TaxID=1126 RepID=UPI003B5888EA